MTTLREAATQALEALEDFGMKHYENTGEVLHRDVYESLKEALVEDAMQKFTDVNQELEAALGCGHCNQPLYAAVKCRVCGRVTEPVQEQPVCDECGKSKCDGWALYCVGCVEPLFTSKTEPVEPVAWMNTEDGFCTLDSPVEGIDVMSQWAPLYAAPPQRKPLSEDEITQAMYRADAIITGPMQFRFTREIERAHGIT